MAAESTAATPAGGQSTGGSTMPRKLTTARVVFVIIAAAAPMAAMVGNTPLALLYGNGPGLPAAYVIATAALLCFCVGYAAMSRRVVNTGAFYTYVARGIGKPAGVGAAYLAVLSYTALTVGLCWRVRLLRVDRARRCRHRRGVGDPVRDCRRVRRDHGLPVGRPVGAGARASSWCSSSPS